jgi:uncharacterized protein
VRYNRNQVLSCFTGRGCVEAAAQQDILTQPPIRSCTAETRTGGGIFLSPLLLFIGWAGTRPASGIAAGFILLNSIAGLLGTTVSIAALPAALPIWAGAALTGALIGTQLGTRTLPVPGVRYALALVLVVAGGKMIFT